MASEYKPSDIADMKDASLDELRNNFHNYMRKGDQEGGHTRSQHMYFNYKGRVTCVTIYWSPMISCCGAANVSVAWPYPLTKILEDRNKLYVLLLSWLSEMVGDHFLNRRCMLVFTDAIFGEAGYDQKESQGFCIWEMMEYAAEIECFQSLEQSKSMVNPKSENAICTWVAFNSIAQGEVVSWNGE